MAKKMQNKNQAQDIELRKWCFKSLGLEFVSLAPLLESYLKTGDMDPAAELQEKATKIDRANRKAE